MEVVLVVVVVMVVIVVVETGGNMSTYNQTFGQYTTFHALS